MGEGIAAANAEDALGRLIDDLEFRQLDARFGRFNLFEAVGGVRSELRHSNFLGFLLSPRRSHGLGSRPLERVLRTILESLPPSERPLRTLELVVKDLDDAFVHRERDNIDVLIEVPELKLVVLIENKVGAAAGGGQLARYKSRVEQDFPNHRRLLVFLTPDGVEPDCEGYVAFSYRRLAQLLWDLAEEQTSPERRLILSHYVEMIRRHVVPDDDLRDLALRLYEKHREAFDFVFDVRPPAESLLNVLRDRILSVEGLIEDRHANNVFRFLPAQWDQTVTALGCDPAKWSHTGRGLLFEAKLNPTTGRVYLVLILGPADGELRKRIYDEAARRPLFRGLVKPMGQQTATIYSRELLTPSQAQDLDFEQQAANVGLAWSDFQGRELIPLIREVEEIVASVHAADSPA